MGLLNIIKTLFQLKKMGPALYAFPFINEEEIRMVVKEKQMSYAFITSISANSVIFNLHDDKGNVIEERLVSSLGVDQSLNPGQKIYA